MAGQPHGARSPGRRDQRRSHRVSPVLVRAHDCAGLTACAGQLISRQSGSGSVRSSRMRSGQRLINNPEKLLSKVSILSSATAPNAKLPIIARATLYLPPDKSSPSVMGKLEPRENVLFALQPFPGQHERSAQREKPDGIGPGHGGPGRAPDWRPQVRESSIRQV
jgi:hypothetical protein